MRKLRAVFCLALVLMLVCGSASAVTLKKGADGLNSLVLNLRLNMLGYDTDPQSSAYSDATAEAVRLFQQNRGLKATGSVDEDTWDMLFSESYRLGLRTGDLGSRYYYVNGRLTAPLCSIEKQEDSSQVLMRLETFDCWVALESPESMDGYVKAEQEYDRNYFDENYKTQYSGTDYRVTGDESIKINGKPARLWSQSWTFVADGVKLYGYAFRGIAELDKVEGKQMYAVVYMYYNVEPAASGVTKTLGTDLVRDVLGNIRCDRDRLADYKAGEAQRRKASKLKITLPEFQPVEEDEQSLLDMVYTIRDNVKPAADGSSGELDPDTCVSMYYGSKIMQYYAGLVEDGNDPASARTLCLLSVANGAFDNGFLRTALKTKDAVSAAMNAAKLALTQDAEPYLVLLGIDKPGWTAEELDELTESLVGSLERTVASQLPGITSVRFSADTVRAKQEIQIIAETSTDTEELCMYTGDKLVRTWTEGYTDKGSIRTWNVSYAFSGVGDRTITFRAGNFAGLSDGMDAAITVTEALAVPTLNSVKFGADSVNVKQDVRIIASTSTDAASLNMYLGDKLITAWTEGYTDKDSIRTWDVTYAFSGKGERTMTFKAENESGLSEGKNATIAVLAVPTLKSVKFGADTVEVKKNVQITAVTSTDADSLNMYTGDKLVRTWTEGFTDKGSVRTWNVSYAFSGVGERTITFRAENSDGLSEGRDAAITVTEALTAPTLVSVKFGADTVKLNEEVQITAVTSKDATELGLYAGERLIQSWTEGYSDSGDLRVWTVNYAFSGAGNRKFIFKAGNSAGWSEGMNAAITVTDTPSVPTLVSVRFEADTVKLKENVQITAVTSKDATELGLYAGEKLVKSWTEGYTDDGNNRIWTVNYAFTGAGNRKLIFKAGNSAGWSEGMNATITVTDTASVPTLTSVSFGAESTKVNKDVTIIAITSTDATELRMYLGTGSNLVMTWTDGYTDNGTLRIWTVKYAFSGAGNRKLIFRAGNEAGLSEGMEATILVK